MGKFLLSSIVETDEKMFFLSIIKVIYTLLFFFSIQLGFKALKNCCGSFIIYLLCRVGVVHVWRSEDSSKESVPSSHRGSWFWDRVHAVRLGGTLPTEVSHWSCGHFKGHSCYT